MWKALIMHLQQSKNATAFSNVWFLISLGTCCTLLKYFHHQYDWTRLSLCETRLRVYHSLSVSKGMKSEGYNTEFWCRGQRQCQMKHQSRSSIYNYLYCLRAIAFNKDETSSRVISTTIKERSLLVSPRHSIKALLSHPMPVNHQYSSTIDKPAWQGCLSWKLCSVLWEPSYTRAMWAC